MIKIIKITAGKGREGGGSEKGMRGKIIINHQIQKL